MKKFLIFLLVATMVLASLTACGKKKPTNDTLDDFVADEGTIESESEKGTDKPADSNNGNNESSGNNENNGNNGNVTEHTHAGGTATCTAKAICTSCGAAYGELNKSNHSGNALFVATALTHEKAYDCCGAIALSEENHKWSNSVCVVCGHEQYKKTTLDVSAISAGNLLTLNTDNAYKGKLDLVNLQSREDRSKCSDGVTNSYTILGNTKDRFFATSATAIALNDMLQDFYNVTKDDNLLISSAYDTAAIEIQDAIYSSGEAIALKYFHDYKANGVNDVRSISGVDTYNWIYANAHKYGFVATYLNSNVFKYVGVTHATAAYEKNLFLGDYLALLNKSTFENPIRINVNDTHIAYFCTIDNVMVPVDYIYEISGNNTTGVIVTVFTDKLANGTADSGNTSTVLPFETVTDFVYVLYPANLRAAASMSSSVLTEVPFGTKLTRTLKNDKWSKVTYTSANGLTYEGYILNDIVTTNEDTIIFGDQGANNTYPVYTLKSGANYILRYYPLADGYPNDFNTISKYDLAEVGVLRGGDEVTVLEVSKDKLWVKVRSTKVDKAVDGTYKQNYTSTAEGYILYSFLEIKTAN